MADIGSMLGGRYRLIELLGQGGMATIYRAHDAQLERNVAVKVLRPEYGSDPDFFARFRQEAQSAASLNHPAVVAVHDYGTDAAGPFIVMELVDGEDLGTIVRRAGALPPRQAARLTAGIARAIGAAHASGFVHRDIKPSNVLVTRQGRVKVTDFGIARAISEAALTLPGTTLGSVHYFSPEQARGETATPASDIYSLGIVLYELLTGRRPWEGDSAAAIATARLTGPVPSATSVRAGIPPILEAIARKAMATNPDDRFASADAMADALERFLSEGAAQAAGTDAAGAGMTAGSAPPASEDTVATASPRGPEGGVGRAPRGGLRAARAPISESAGAAGAGGAASMGAAGSSDDAGTAGIEGTAGSERTSGEPATAGLAGTARANPGAHLPYPIDAYAGSDEDLRPRTRPVGAGRLAPDADLGESDDDREGTSPWLWVSGILAIVILGLAAFLVFRLLNSSPQPGPEQVAAPSLVGKTYEAAKAAAQNVGLKVARAAFAPSDRPDGTVLAQDPASGDLLDKGSTIKLTLALGDQTVTVPDLRGKTETEAVNLIASAKLTIGTRAEAFDTFIPLGAVVSQDPGAGVVVTQGLSVNYVVSKGPEPTPSASPSESPSPSPLPTEAPTPPPTPGPRNTGNYLCQTLGAATAAIESDGFVVGGVTALPGGTADADWIVVAQDPGAGTNAAFGSPVNLTVYDPASLPTCPP